jgi:hypothetical protein
MLQILIWATAAVCVLATMVAYAQFKDVFHPLIFIPPMFGFIYVYMPLHFIDTGELFAFVSEPQATFVQLVILLTVSAFILGCFSGSRLTKRRTPMGAVSSVNVNILRYGAYALGLIGLFAWAVTIRNAGGFTGAFGAAYGAGKSDYGYVREAVYLLIAALLLLISPEGFQFPEKKWTAAVIAFSTPWLMQGLLGARRGPTFVITVTLGMSWFLARRTRPSPIIIASGGMALGLLMLFLVTNRGKIHLGGDLSGAKTDVTEVVTSATEANEYIFGAGCIIATDATGGFYWGRRYLAEVLVRPIPKQLWPNKYQDFGVPELLQNAGVAVEGLASILGWQQIPGAAAAMVADLWVEFYWLAVPVAALIGWAYGYVWRRAIQDGRFWTTEYTILALLSIYLVTQSGEAVIFRLVILTVTCQFIWRKAISKGSSGRPFAPPRIQDKIAFHV